MADQRKGGIGWADETWNPVRGCSRVSPECLRCYAEDQALRIARFDRGRGVPEGQGAYDGLVKAVDGDARWTGKVRFVREHLSDPLRWRRPRRIFVNSMSDLFHEELTDDQIAAVFGAMLLAPQHTFIVLTKRARRMREWFAQASLTDCVACYCVEGGPDVYAGGWELGRKEVLTAVNTGWPASNVWLVVSAGAQPYADQRIHELLLTPAAVRGVSYEPMIGPLNLESVAAPLASTPGLINALSGDFWPALGDVELEHERRYELPKLDWVIAGGESGPGHRVMDPAWLASIDEQTRNGGTALFVKQDSGHRDGQQGRIPDAIWARKEFPKGGAA